MEMVEAKVTGFEEVEGVTAVRVEVMEVEARSLAVALVAMVVGRKGEVTDKVMVVDGMVEVKVGGWVEVVMDAARQEAHGAVEKVEAKEVVETEVAKVAAVKVQKLSC